MNLQSLFTPDLVNGLFELGGVFSIGYNTYRVWKDKMVRGVSIPSTAFFTSWGIWNLYFYPHLNQPPSFCGGVGIVLANAAWLALMYRYRNGTMTGLISTAAPVHTETLTFDEMCEALDKQDKN